MSQARRDAECWRSGAGLRAVSEEWEMPGSSGALPALPASPSQLAEGEAGGI